jgi:DNA-binding XRE family transcriptional regulator
MAIRNIIMGGREYVLIPRKEWDSFAASRKSTGDKQPQPPPMRDGSYTIEHVRMSLANKMASRRKSAGITQAQLAKLAGVRVETISRLENGLHMPGSRTFDKIDRALSRANKVRAA